MNACLLLLAMAAYASAHLCLLTPEQRGSMTNLNKPGADDCFLINAPCGGRNLTTIAATFSREDANPVIFQKNLDHFNKDSPGRFSISLWQDKRQYVLRNISDDASPSGTIYETDVILHREVMPGPAIIQVVYVTKNPNAPPNFYQCSDIMVE